MVLAPKSAAECANLLKLGLDQGEPIRIVGGETRVYAGRGRTLSTQNLNQIRFFHPEDMVIGVEAGMPFTQLRQLLVKARMDLPVNAWFANATIGGMVAANDFGPDRFFGGGLRDYMIGVEYVDGTGHLVKAGGRVVKNVTGYDASRMMIGSRGGLGCLTAVNFRLIPAKPNPMVGFLNCDSLDSLNHLHALVAARVPIDWVQIRGGQAGWQMALGFSGNQPRRDHLLNKFTQYLGPDWDYCSEQELTEPWHWAHATRRSCGFLESKPAALAETPWHLHLVAPTSAWQIPKLIAAVGANGWLVLHPFGGDAHVFYHATATPAATIEAMLERWRDWAMVECVHVPDTVLHHWGRIHPLPPEYDLMVRLKKQLDPKSLFDAPFYRSHRCVGSE